MVLSITRNFFRGSSDLNLSMYPVKGNCRLPNIMEQLANGTVESVDVTSGYYYIGNWKCGINLSEIDGQMHLRSFVSYKSIPNPNYPKCRIEYYLRYKNYSDHHCALMKTVLPSEWDAHGSGLKFSDLKPELLDNGALIIEYGIRVESILTADNIWSFQLLSDLFDSKGNQVMVPIRKNAASRCHPQIKAIHLDNSIRKEQQQYHGAYNPLQIAHGVRYQLNSRDLYWTAHEARLLGLRNVIHYCQWQMIRQPFTWPFYDSESRKFECVIDCEMRSYLVHLIRELDSKTKLMNILKDVSIHKMPGESMKTFMKFLLYD